MSLHKGASELTALTQRQSSVKEACLLEFKYIPAWSVSQQPRREAAEGSKAGRASAQMTH